MIFLPFLMKGKKSNPSSRENYKTYPCNQKYNLNSVAISPMLILLFPRVLNSFRTLLKAFRPVLKVARPLLKAG